MVPCLVITHGNLGAEFIHLVELVLGPVEGLSSLSNTGRSARELVEVIGDWIDNESADPSQGKLILVDEYGSSCANAALLACEERWSTVILCGVNLAMLLTYASRQERLTLDELAQKVLEAGRQAIVKISPTGSD